MKLSVQSRHGDVVCLRLEGRVSQRDISPNEEPLSDLLGDDAYAQKLAIDMTDVASLDSSGVNWLLVCQKRMRHMGGQLVLYALSPIARNVIRVLNLQTVFRLADDEPSAVRMPGRGSCMTETPVDRSEEFRLNELVKMPAEEAVHRLLERAAELRSSDLFFLAEDRYVTIAVRRLGMVEKLAVVSPDQGRQMLTHIKANARMDIAEGRRPADGRWIQDFSLRRLDMRISTVPTLHGEDMTIRLWDHSLGLLELEELGLTRSDLAKLTYLMNHPSGLVLVTGPTGTGKTTTLYACLKYLNDGAHKINTLEDPVEYALEGVRQSQINTKLGLDFPEMLRTVLRQAPDIIMIGEIRDQDTATTAVRAANSGHLVLATLHSPTAAGAVQSILALGAHPYFLSGCLLGIVAQRLVRTLCPKCRVRYDFTDSPETFRDVMDLLEPGEGTAIFGPGGCEECFQIGYAGRTGIFEILTVNQEIRRLIARGATSHEIQDAAVRTGLVIFRRAALLKVARGITSTEEILRDVPADQLGLED